MGRRQSAPRRQNTLEHGILDDGSLSPPSSFDLPDHSTLLSCLYQHLARLKLAHHGVTTRAILSRPISSAEHYDPFPLLLPCLFSLSLVSPICLFFLGLSSSCAAFRIRAFLARTYCIWTISRSLHGAFIVFFSVFPSMPCKRFAQSFQLFFLYYLG
jgi:hypothetical protein